jgi:hypothetical protein
MSKKKEKVQVYEAKTNLRQKVGSGPLDPKAVARAQKAIEDNKVDFAPLGLQFLQELQEGLNDAEKHRDEEHFEEQKQALTSPVMELKANATTFHYDLVGTLATIMLNFLESIERLDKDALSIVQAHHDTLKGIIGQNIHGDGGQQGKIFVQELKDACARYYKKRKKKKETKEKDQKKS